MSNALLDNQSITIGQGVTFKGSLNVPSKAVINGTVDGDLTADELEIGPTGKITGLITARKIDVQGELHQVITCKDHLMIIKAFLTELNKRSTRLWALFREEINVYGTKARANNDLALRGRVHGHP
jgi:hypothetical protein